MTSQSAYDEVVRAWLPYLLPPLLLLYFLPRVLRPHFSRAMALRREQTAPSLPQQSLEERRREAVARLQAAHDSAAEVSAAKAAQDKVQAELARAALAASKKDTKSSAPPPRWNAYNDGGSTGGRYRFGRHKDKAVSK